MSQLPYHKRYHSDALAGFMPLTLEERGAFQTLLDMIYDRGGPIDDNERLLAGYMNCSIRKWRAIRDELIAKRKIRIDHLGRITNERAEKEIENGAKTSRKLIESGAKGGRKRAENEKNTNENSESGQASLEPALSEAQAIPDTRSQKEDTYLPQSTDSREPESAGRQAVDLAEELVGMVGLSLSSPTIVANAVRQVETWLADGIDPDAVIRPVIRNCLANGGEPTRSLRRFDAVIRHDHAKRNPGKAAPVKPPPVADQVRMFEEQAERLERIGQSEAAAEFTLKAERLRTAGASR